MPAAGSNASLTTFEQNGLCLRLAGEGLAMTACDMEDAQQQWLWNVTAKNALPKGSKGFVESPAAGTNCTVGSKEMGCCITNNGVPAPAMWGCCP